MDIQAVEVGASLAPTLTETTSSEVADSISMWSLPDLAREDCMLFPFSHSIPTAEQIFFI